MWFEIPLSGNNESFSLSILGVQWGFRLFYRQSPYNFWVLDLLDPNTGSVKFGGIPLTTGEDLLKPFSKSQNLGFGLFVATDGDPDAPPTASNLGSEAHLYVQTTVEGTS